ncbi:MAG: type IV pilus modification protein PilV [Gammaproteobacteria bacterium]|nr:type IV pilus modification protein PilV [Gammaproteobacteria bacterium]
MFNQKYKGFTLVEVLVTVVIMAMGLLGLAGLQTTSLRYNLDAEQRGTAVQLVYDMSERMRAMTNRELLSGLEKYTEEGVEEASCTSYSANAVAGCTPLQMASHDKFEWLGEISNSLPGGEGYISVAAGIYTITVTWDDNRDGNTDASDASFSARFQP